MSPSSLFDKIAFFIERGHICMKSFMNGLKKGKDKHNLRFKIEMGLTGVEVRSPNRERPMGFFGSGKLFKI